MNEQKNRLEGLDGESKREIAEVRRVAQEGLTAAGPEFEKKLAAVLQRSVEKLKLGGVAGQGDNRVTLLEGKVAKLTEQFDVLEAILERDWRKLDELWSNRGCEDVIAMIEESLVQDREKLGELWYRYTEENGWEERIERRVDQLEADKSELADKVSAVDGVMGTVKGIREMGEDLRRTKEEVAELRGLLEGMERRVAGVVQRTGDFNGEKKVGGG